MYSTFVFDLKLISSYSIFIPIFFEIMQRFFQRFYLTLSCIKMKNCQTYFQNPVVWTPKDFQSIFGHFWKLCMKGLNIYLTNWFRWIFHFFILLAPSSKEFSNKYMSVLFQYVFMSRSINVLFLVYECVENPCYCRLQMMELRKLETFSFLTFIWYLNLESKCPSFCIRGWFSTYTGTQ